MLPWNQIVFQELQISNYKSSAWPDEWRKRTCVMGIVNITPDSFSDGGESYTPHNALLKANKCVLEGADVVDLGGQSTRPAARFLEPEEEIKRVLPALKLIRKELPKSLISVDTFHSTVAKKALEEGVNWINDVTGGRYDPKILEVAGDADCPFILTHSRGDSHTMDNLTEYNNVTSDVIDELSRRTEKALEAGIREKNLIWDPGIGFAKSIEQNLILLQNLEDITANVFPVLIGASRKRFIGAVINQDNPLLRINGNLAVVCRCLQANVSMVRVHDVKATSEIIAMSKAIDRLN